MDAYETQTEAVIAALEQERTRVLDRLEPLASAYDRITEELEANQTALAGYRKRRAENWLPSFTGGPVLTSAKH